MALGLGLAAGCGGDDPAGPGRIPTSLVKVAGDSQQVTVGTVAALPLVVQVTDAGGTPVSGVLINFTVDSAGGTVAPNAVTTGPDGRAASVWQAPTVVGTFAVRASAAAVDSVLFSTRTVAAAAAIVSIQGGNGQVGEAGQTLDSLVRVRVLDGFGNPVVGATVGFQVVSGGGSVGSATLLTDTAGLAATAWHLDQSAGFDTLLATAESLPALVFDALTFAPQRPDSVAAGGGSTCELPVGGGMRCWGDGSYTPVVMPGLPTFSALTAGSFESCGLTAGGETWCWAAPFGTATGSQVAIGQSFSQISFGEQYQCGLTGDGVVSCRQQVGSFLPVAGNRRWRQVNAGLTHVCALTREGRAYCWGSDSQEQLGNGQSGTSPTPDSVKTAERFHLIAAGGTQSCGLTPDGRLFCWGTLSNGAQPIQFPLEVAPSRRFRSVDAGLGSVCAVQLDGTGYCFGAMPSNQTGALTFRQLSVGGAHGCGQTTSGETWCWGSNQSGSIGVGPTFERLAPDSVLGGLTFASVTTGFNHSCGLTVAGQAWCWGEGGAGQLGGGTLVSSAVPVSVVGGYTFAALEGGLGTTCGVTAAGEGYCWGALVGNNFPTLVPGGHSFTSIAVGGASACGVTAGGAALCWGRNDLGQLGDSTTTDAPAPVPVAGGLTFAQLSVGSTFTCGVTSANAAWCWGGGGSLGDSALAGHLTPGPVSGGHAFNRIAVSGSNLVACAITTTDDAWCWGQGMDGQLGDGTFQTPAPGPVAVSGGYLLRELALANNSTCGRSTSGAALCWGYNGDGELGDGTGISSATPVGIQGGITASSVSTAGLHGCAVDAAGKAYCWGRNEYGQLGIGVSGLFTAPVQVP